VLLLGAILFWWGKGNEEKRFSIRTEEGLEKDESQIELKTIKKEEESP
jgi:hypothetical protein